MKRIFPFLLSIAFLAACAISAPTAPTATAQPASGEVTNTPVSPTNTSIASTSTPIPPTATPVPPARWYWAVEDGTNQLLAVNQFGERRAIGSLPASGLGNYQAFPVDSERAVLFTEVDSRLRASLLTPDGMQPISLPSITLYNDYARSSWYVPAVYGDTLVFAYTTQGSFGGDTSATADRGPLVLLDLQSLTASILDEDVNHDILTYAMNDTRLWAHVSEDGRFLRYLNGDSAEMSLRELDLATGEVRTVYTTTGHATSRIFASLQGDMWRFMRDDIVFDLDGNQMEFTGDTHTLRPLRDGRALVIPYGCDDDCQLRVVSPFTDAPEITYTLPWSSSSTHNPLVYQFAPDQSLIFLGTPYGLLSNTPAILADTPALRDDDQPVFRLTPDGGARLVGFFDFDMSTIPASSDGHYLLLEAVDHTSFFVYDVFEDRPLAEMPAFPELDYFWATAAFYENGLVVHLTAATPDSTYREFYLAHSFLTGNSAAWDDESWIFDSCMDMLPDDSLVCWAYDEAGQSYSLVRYDPWTKESTILLENGVIITALE